MSDAPLVLTLTLDAPAQERFDALRRRHFPADRNHLAAHVTLFHHLPGDRRAAVEDDVAEAAAGTGPLRVTVERVRSLGRGVAYDLVCPPLLALRAGLADRWRAHLTPQDRQWSRPHVTVQNKVTPDRARATLADLAAAFAPYEVTGTGLALWRYLGGPWEPLRRWGFSPAGG